MIEREHGERQQTREPQVSLREAWLQEHRRVWLGSHNRKQEDADLTSLRKQLTVPLTQGVSTDDFRITSQRF